MSWFKKEEEDFDDSTAFDSDKGAVTKIILGVMILIVIFGAIGWIGYNQFNKSQNVNNNESSNQTSDLNVTDLEDGKIVVNFTTFNLTVTENPTGVYYYTTQDKVIDEKCYIDGKEKSCGALTNSACARNECTKELEIIKECFVNNEKIDCPDE